MIPEPALRFPRQGLSPTRGTKRLRNATYSFDRFTASADVSITGKWEMKGTPSARRIASDLCFRSIASAELPPFSADTTAPILHVFPTYNIMKPVRRRQDRTPFGGAEFARRVLVAIQHFAFMRAKINRVGSFLSASSPSCDFAATGLARSRNGPEADLSRSTVRITVS